MGDFIWGMCAPYYKIISSTKVNVELPILIYSAMAMSSHFFFSVNDVTSNFNVHVSHKDDYVSFWHLF